MSTKKLLIIDGNALMHRAFHALPDFISKNGVPTNALYGFASVLHKVRQDMHPTHVMVCFDTPSPTFRDALFKEYRAQRPKVDNNLIKQFPLVKEFLTKAGIQFIEKDGFEADDLIAIAVKKAEHAGYHTIVLTGDKDIFQLISDKTLVLTPQIGYQKQGILYDSQKVHEKFGVAPEEIPDYKALVGDPSDNYKGVPGIGPKAAISLLNSYKTVENLYTHIEELQGTKLHTLLVKNKENALMAKKLAVLVSESPDVHLNLDETVFNHYNDALRDFFTTYQIRSLQQRFFSEALRTDKVNEKIQLDLF